MKHGYNHTGWRDGGGRWSLPGRMCRGIVLPVVLILGLLMLTAAGGLIMVSSQQSRTTSRYETYKDEFTAAEMGVNKAYAQIQYMTANHTPNLADKLATVAAPQSSGLYIQPIQHQSDVCRQRGGHRGPL